MSLVTVTETKFMRRCSCIRRRVAIMGLGITATLLLAAVVTTITTIMATKLKNQREMNRAKGTSLNYASSAAAIM